MPAPLLRRRARPRPRPARASGRSRADHGLAETCDRSSFVQAFKITFPHGRVLRAIWGVPTGSAPRPDRSAGSLAHRPRPPPPRTGGGPGRCASGWRSTPSRRGLLALAITGPRRFADVGKGAAGPPGRGAGGGKGDSSRLVRDALRRGVDVLQHLLADRVAGPARMTSPKAAPRRPALRHPPTGRAAEEGGGHLRPSTAGGVLDDVNLPNLPLEGRSWPTFLARSSSHPLPLRGPDRRYVPVEGVHERQS